jgi:type IV/VI secretion system ImpK/VasF family protein
MKLIDVCEPLFLYASSLKRAGRRSASPQAAQVRSAVKKVFDQMRAAAAGDVEVEEQYDEVELPLVFFMDFVILESDLDFARDWEPLAFERNELAGDQKFFDMLESTLAEEGDAALERLLVYHTCLGLGFTGMYDAGAEELLRLRRKAYSRARKAAGIEAVDRMCADAYEHVDTGSYIHATGRSLGAMAIALVGLIGVLIIANFFLFRSTSTAISTALNKMLTRSVEPVERVGPGIDRAD